MIYNTDDCVANLFKYSFFIFRITILSLTLPACSSIVYSYLQLTNCKARRISFPICRILVLVIIRVGSVYPRDTNPCRAEGARAMSNFPPRVKWSQEFVPGRSVRQAGDT